VPSLPNRGTEERPDRSILQHETTSAGEALVRRSKCPPSIADIRLMLVVCSVQALRRAWSARKEATMPIPETCAPDCLPRSPWYKALFNLAIDSKLRAGDLVEALGSVPVDTFAPLKNEE
jgi:hypothetical protein